MIGFSVDLALFFCNTSTNKMFSFSTSKNICVRDAYFDFVAFLFSFLTGTFLIGSSMEDSFFISGGVMISSGNVTFMVASKQKLHEIKYSLIDV